MNACFATEDLVLGVRPKAMHLNGMEMKTSNCMRSQALPLRLNGIKLGHLNYTACTAF